MASKGIDGSGGDGRGPSKRRAGTLTKARRERFLSTLAMTCNVDRSCKVAGLCVSGAYKIRARDPGFARDWVEALAQGYLHLEGELLRRALGGPDDEPEGDGEDDPTRGPDAGPGGAAKEGDVRPFDPDLALRLLNNRLRSDAQGRRVPTRFKQPSRDEVLASLDRKLTAMEKRLGATKLGDGRLGGESPAEMPVARPAGGGR